MGQEAQSLAVVDLYSLRLVCAGCIIPGGRQQKSGFSGLKYLVVASSSLLTAGSTPRSASELIPALALSPAQVPPTLTLCGSRALQRSRYQAVTLHRVFCWKKPVPSWDPYHSYHCSLG